MFGHHVLEECVIRLAGTVCPVITFLPQSKHQPNGSVTSHNDYNTSMLCLLFVCLCTLWSINLWSVIICQISLLEASSEADYRTAKTDIPPKTNICSATSTEFFPVVYTSMTLEAGCQPKSYVRCWYKNRRWTLWKIFFNLLREVKDRTILHSSMTRALILKTSDNGPFSSLLCFVNNLHFKTLKDVTDY